MRNFFDESAHGVYRHIPRDRGSGKATGRDTLAIDVGPGVHAGALAAHLAREVGQGVESAEGINLSQMTLMGQVEALGGSARMVDLADRLQVSKPAITKIVDALERLGYLKRGRSESDRRVIHVELTPEGSQVRARAEAVFESTMQAGLWDHLSAEETSGMVKLRERLQVTLGLSQASLMPPSH